MLLLATQYYPRTLNRTYIPNHEKLLKFFLEIVLGFSYIIMYCIVTTATTPHLITINIHLIPSHPLWVPQNQQPLSKFNISIICKETWVTPSDSRKCPFDPNPIIIASYEMLSCCSRKQSTEASINMNRTNYSSCWNRLPKAPNIQTAATCNHRIEISYISVTRITLATSSCHDTRTKILQQLLSSFHLMTNDACSECCCCYIVCPFCY